MPDGVSIEAYELALRGGGVISLPGSVLLTMTGADRVRYLNGQVTQDVRRLEPGAAKWACVCNHKGKLEAMVAISLHGAEGIRVSGPEAARDFLPLRLEKYIIADDVALQDDSDAFSLAHALGGEKPHATAVSLDRFGIPGWDVWLRAEETAAFMDQRLRISAEMGELMRIEHGIPAWGAELGSDTLPPEAGLDATAIDYHKGCYIGQEVISRMKTAGRVNRSLRKFAGVEGTVAAGQKLFLTGDGGLREAGRLTSAAWHPGLEKMVALGYVRRDCIPAAGRFETGEDAAALSGVVEMRIT